MMYEPAVASTIGTMLSKRYPSRNALRGHSWNVVLSISAAAVIGTNASVLRIAVRVAGSARPARARRW